MESNNYSKAQSEAIRHGEGPLLVLAGPGSGKTFVITNRIKYLIDELNIKPDNILVVTFSRLAATQMKNRFEKISESRGVIFGTFHSIFFGILKKAYGYSSDQILKESEKYNIVQEIVSNIPDFASNIATVTNNIIEEISKLKQERIDIRFFYSKICSSDIFRKIYQIYENKISSIRKIDFDDMLLMTYDLLNQRQDIRKLCSMKYKYILVDEFQDINNIQYMIVKLLLNDSKNITIVGDDDQSIYSFRGARPDIMLNFDKDFHNCKKVILDINFRSSSQIVEASSKLIKHNKLRFDKVISSYRGNGKNVDILKFKNLNDEVKTIIEDIRDYLKLGYRYNDIAILYRTNIQPRLIIERFLKLAIPFTLNDNVANIYEHWISRDIIAYLSLASENIKRADLLRIINKPNRYIKREAFQASNIKLDDIYNYYKDNRYIKENIDDLKNSLRVIRSLSLYKAISFIRKGVGYDNYLKEYCEYYSIENEEFFDILDELQLSSENYNNLNEWLLYMQKYKEDLENVKINVDNESQTDSIKLMTFHSSKGLEFKIVYIIDANDGICPYKKAKTKEDIEEERRMFYVAMTRARDKLNICTTLSKNNKISKISKFIKEII